MFIGGKKYSERRTRKAGNARAALEQGWQLKLGRLGESPLGTGEGTLEIDRIEPVGPRLDCCTVGLGGLLVRTQDLDS